MLLSRLPNGTLMNSDLARHYAYHGKINDHSQLIVFDAINYEDRRAAAWMESA